MVTKQFADYGACYIPFVSTMHSICKSHNTSGISLLQNVLCLLEWRWEERHLLQGNAVSALWFRFAKKKKMLMWLEERRLQYLLGEMTGSFKRQKIFTRGKDARVPKKVSFTPSQNGPYRKIFSWKYFAKINLSLYHNFTRITWHRPLGNFMPPVVILFHDFFLSINRNKQFQMWHPPKEG